MGGGFIADNCFRNSAALSFYTLFSLAPALLIAIYSAGIFASDIDFQQKLTGQISRLLGPESAQGISLLLDTLQQEGQATWRLIVGIAVLLFSATNIFLQLSGSFNDIFKVKPREGKGILKETLDRLMSLGMLISLGLVMVISLILDSVVVSVKDYFEQNYSETMVNLVVAAENLILLLLVFGIIYAIFKLLPDVVIPRRYNLQASLVVTLLLFAGKFGISWYIGNSRFSELGGASASIIVLMLWVYYSSLIMFLGAELAKSMGEINDEEFKPNRYARLVEFHTKERPEREQKSRPQAAHSF